MVAWCDKGLRIYQTKRLANFLSPACVSLIFDALEGPRSQISRTGNRQGHLNGIFILISQYNVPIEFDSALKNVRHPRSGTSFFVLLKPL